MRQKNWSMLWLVFSLYSIICLVERHAWIFVCSIYLFQFVFLKWRCSYEETFPWTIVQGQGKCNVDFLLRKYFLKSKQCISKCTYHLHSINMISFTFFTYSSECTCHRFVNLCHVTMVATEVGSLVNNELKKNTRTSSHSCFPSHSIHIWNMLCKRILAEVFPILKILTCKLEIVKKDQWIGVKPWHWDSLVDGKGNKRNPQPANCNNMSNCRCRTPTLQSWSK